jgi:hypothetical protein
VPRIYHITHESNLPAILRAGGLRCVTGLGGIGVTSIAHANIQDRRSTTCVTCGPGGVVHDYVPFYFGPRSPMLFSIARGNVTGYSGGQDAIVHLVSETGDVAAANIPFVFTDGHAAMIPLTSFFDNLSVLAARVDLPLMKAQFWNDTPVDNDRKRRRQAEFLIYQFAPWTLIRGIGVRTAAAKARVEATLASGGQSSPVVVLPQWYYEGYV